MRLHTPPGEPPYLHTARGRKDRRIVLHSATGGYCWADTQEEAGHPRDADNAAKLVAKAMDAPLRGM